MTPKCPLKHHQKWLNEKEEIQEKFREFLVQVAEAEKIRNPLNAFGDIMITSGITTEFEKLSHQEKYQAVRDTQAGGQEDRRNP